MARKNLNRGLGALAALGALSYHLSKGKGRTDGGAPVEFRGSDSRNDPATYEGAGVTEIGMGDRAAAAISDAQREAARREGMNVSEGERVAQGAAERGDIAQMMDAGYFNRARPAGAAATARPPAGPAASAAARAPINDRDHFFSGPMTPRIPEGSPSYYDPRTANLSSAAVGRGEADAIRNAANAQTPLRSQLTQTTLGVPTGPAPGAPSIYAGPEAWRLYNEQKAAEAAAAGPSAPQGSARNIRQQMREKDKAVVAAVRRRQEQEAAAAAQNRAAAEQRRIDAELSLDPMERLSRGYKKGGAIKTKKMASGGMTSASKRGDGIASKGKTKCKMY